MSNHSNFDILVYHSLRIVNTINFVLLFGVLFSWLELNKYISFVLLTIISGFVVIASTIILEKIFLVPKNQSIESTFSFKIISFLAFLALMFYLGWTSEWIFMFIFVGFNMIFFVITKVMQKNRIV